MSGSATPRLSQLLLRVWVLAALCALLACESSSRVTFGNSTAGGTGEEDGGDGGEGSEAAESESADATLFAAADALSAVTGEAALDPGSLSSIAGRGVLFFDRNSESILLLDLDGRPILYTPRYDLLAITGGGSVALGRMDVARGGPFDGQALCVDAISGLLLRIGVDGIPHVHAAETQVLAATGESSSRLHLPRSMASDQIIAQDLESRHILSFGARGDARILVEGSDLALAAGVPVDAAEITSWARAPVSGDHFGSFASTNAVVRVRPDGLVDRYVHQQVLRAVLPRFRSPAIVELATDEAGGDELYLLVGDDGRGRGIVLVSPTGAIRRFTNFNDFPETSGFVDIFDCGFLTLGGDRLFYALDGIGASVFTLDASGVPDALWGPGHLFGATGAPRINLGPGTPIDDLGLIVFEPESGSFVLLRRRPLSGPLVPRAPRRNATRE